MPPAAERSGRPQNSPDRETRELQVKPARATSREERKDQQCEVVRRCGGKAWVPQVRRRGGRRLNNIEKAQERMRGDAGGLGSCRVLAKASIFSVKHGVRAQECGGLALALPK